MRNTGVRLAVLAATLAYCAASAAAESVADILRQHELIGTRAVDCSNPPSNARPYVVYRVAPDGTVKSDILADGSRVVASNTVLTVEEIEPTLLRITQSSGVDPGLSVEFDLRIDGDRSRSIRSVASDGRKLIVDGRLTVNNQETFWLTKCRAEG